MNKYCKFTIKELENMMECGINKPEYVVEFAIELLKENERLKTEAKLHTDIIDPISGCVYKTGVKE